MIGIMRGHLRFIGTLALVLFAPEGRAGSFNIFDPQGDHVGIHDVSELTASVNGMSLDLTVRYFTTITDSQSPDTGPNDIFGFLDIDADRDGATGIEEPDLMALRSFGSLPGLGVDFYLDLFQEQPGTPSLVPLIDGTGSALDWVPILYGLDSHSLTISVPWALLGFTGAGDVDVNAGFIALDNTTIPNAPFVSDTVSNLQAPAVPEPESLAQALIILGLGAPVAYGCHRRRGSLSP